MKRILVLCCAAVAVFSCTEQKRAALLPADNFNTTVDGKAVSLYTLKAGDIIAQFTNFGGRGVSLWTPDRKGDMEDIVIGHNNINDYLNPPKERFFGACVGPVANRIGKGTFTVDGTEYHTPINDNGVNTLHGGLIGVDNVVWDVVSADDKSLVLHYLRPDGFEGYPGNLDITMTYSVSEDNSLTVTYEATTDKATPVNFSHHPFFNLRGEGEGTIDDYLMYIKAGRIVAIDSLSIPTGELLDVAGTAFDFRTAHPIGERIGENHPQLVNGNGYDHNWCIDKDTDGVELVCTVFDPVSGRQVEVLTDQPGMQFYSGNFFTGVAEGKTGKPIGFRSCLALETQKYPDSPNHEGFTDIILRPGEKYTQTCIYRFSAK